MILFEVRTMDSFQDDLGPCFDCALFWNNQVALVLPQVNPNGVHFYVEAFTADTEETIRDRIRDAAISIAEADFGFTGLTRDVVRVNGYTNDTSNDKAGTGTPPPTVWYAGTPISPNIPGKLTVLPKDRVRVHEVTTTVVFNPNLNPDQRPDYLRGQLTFQTGYFPTSLDRIKFMMEAWGPTDTEPFWDTHIFMSTTTNGLMTPLVDLNAGAQALFWTTGIVTFKLGVDRFSATQDIKPIGSGVLVAAQIEWVWT